MGRKFTPLPDRLRTYDAVRSLVESQGEMGVSRIVCELRESGLVLPSRETIRHWALGQTSPFSGLRAFTPHPSAELSFFAGAWLGDGWGDENDGGKRMRLKVRSRSFANEFAKAATIILAKQKPYRTWTSFAKGGQWFNVKVTSCMLFDFITASLEELKPFISPFPRDFLRGFYTAEGNPSVSISRRGPRLDVGLDLSNSAFELMEYSRSLLLSLGFRAGRIRQVLQRGEVTNLGTASRPGWLMTLLRFGDVVRFARIIGFADHEKQQELDEAISIVQTLGSRNAVSKWQQLYEKRNREWVRKPER